MSVWSGQDAAERVPAPPLDWDAAKVISVPLGVMAVGLPLASTGLGSDTLGMQLVELVPLICSGELGV
jgi:hypothetical protein